jgi:hypothetical protein
MVKSTLYKGIEFVRISSLPKSEQELFTKSFNYNFLIKILMGEEIVHDCIQYKDYVLWYRNFILKETIEVEITAHEEVATLEEVESL